MQRVPDHSHEWLSRLKEETKEDQCILQYLEWMRTKKPKQQIRYRTLRDWLKQVATADFSDPLVAIHFRSTLFSREVDYLELALDENLKKIFVVIPDPGALRIYGNRFVNPEAFAADDGLQMHPALLSLSLLDCHTPNPKAHIPELVLPVGPLWVRAPISYERPWEITPFYQEVIRSFGVTIRTPESRPSVYNEPDYEKFRRQAWKVAKESDSMKDTEYFVVIDVVTPGHPVWIIYNPDREGDSEDLTVTDLLQSTSKFPEPDIKSGFGAAQIWTGINEWLNTPGLWNFRKVLENISQTNVSYPVVGRLENLESARQVFSKRKSG